ncbi:iron uptake porin [Geitlerinema sp. CS-897]|nr:iron uptake porin [Geitlerinema sp. CS-897]
MLLFSPAFVTLLGLSAPVRAENEKLEIASEVGLSKPEAIDEASFGSKQISVSDFIDATEERSLDRPSANRDLDQVTSVSQLSDVQPTDWAFQALQSLVERYGCIAGYPDGTYRGNSFMTRYEFAAGVNACLDQIVALIGGGDTIDPADLATIRRLQEEFAAELAALRGRVDGLEARVAELEANQFSTTTKLQGEVVFGLADAWGGEDVDIDNNQTVFQYRARLAFVSSFTGRDQLWTRLDAGNATYFNNLDQGVFTHSFDSGSSVEIGWLAYYFPIGDNVQVYLPAAYPLWQDFVPTVSPYFEGFTGASNALSSFAESSPIYKVGLSNGGGIGFNVEATDWLTVSAGYFGGDSFSPSQKEGLFNGEYSMLGQFTFNFDNLQVGLTYNHAYFNDSPNSDNGIFDLGPGTFTAVQPFGGNAALYTNSYGAAASYQLGDSISINAFGGYTDAESRASGKDDAEIWYYGLGLAFPDLGGDGNLLGIMAGAEPYVGGLNGSSDDSVADDTPFHLEAFYRYQLNDNISITPGVIWLTAPQGEKDNDDAVVGILRTTFTF